MKIKFYLLDTDYVNHEDETLIRLTGVDSNGRSVCVLDTLTPYVYAVPDKITKKLLKSIRDVDDPPVENVEAVERVFRGEEREVIRVETVSPPDVSNMRETIKKLDGMTPEDVYEYDINFYKRYLIDNGIQPGSWYTATGEKVDSDWSFDRVIRADIIESREGKRPELKLVAFDLETYERGGDSEVVMASVYGGVERVFTTKDADYPDYVTVVDSEKALLEGLIGLILEEDPDVVVTYNGDEFDFSVLRERCEEHDVPLVLSRDGESMTFKRRMRVSSARLGGRLHFDIYRFVNHALSYHLDTEVLTLDAVASEVLGDAKTGMSYEDIKDAWRSGENLEELAEYNLKDSELTYRLAERMLPQAMELARVVGVPPFDVTRMSYSQLVEGYMMRRSAAENRIIPNTPNWPEVQERRKRGAYEGGFVKQPEAGIHEDLAVMDFRSLYPSIIASHNISPETLNCDCCSVEAEGTDYVFCEEDEGFYSTAVRDLIEERLRVKEELKRASGSRARALELEELAVKMIANASYGALAYTGARWYCYECADAASALGRHYIADTIKSAEESGFEVIYADTDSCFVKGMDDMESAVSGFINEVNAELPELMELDLEGFYPRGLFIPKGSGGGAAKKRYALIDREGHLVIKGLETVRRDWCKLAKEVQERVIRFILEDRDKDGAIEYMRGVLTKLEEKEVGVKDLAINTQLTKPIEEYKSKSPHVEAAKKIRDRGRPYGPGMIVTYIITEGEGSISDRAEPIEDAEPVDVDAGYYINNQVLPAGMRVLQVLDVTEDELEGMGHQSTIRKFTK